MGQLIPVTRNEETLQAMQIETREEMFTVYAFATDHGYTAHLNADANGQHTLGITAPGGNTSQSARINDWAVLKNGAIVTLVPAEQAGVLYTPA